MPRKIIRCKSCRSLKDKPHKPFCKGVIKSIYPNGPVYVESTSIFETGPGAHDSSSTSDSGSGGCA